MESQSTTAKPVITFQCSGEQLTIVRLYDGGCGIQRNGQLVADCSWPAEHADLCAERYARLVMLRLANEMNGSTLPVALPATASLPLA
jgi:hypothetical protein